MTRLKTLYNKWNDSDFYEEPRPRRKPAIDNVAWRKISNAPRLLKIAGEIIDNGSYLSLIGAIFVVGYFDGLSNQFPPGLLGAYSLLALSILFFIASLMGGILLAGMGILIGFREQRKGKIAPRCTADQILDRYGFNPDKTPKQPIPQTRLRNKKVIPNQ